MLIPLHIFKWLKSRQKKIVYQKCFVRWRSIGLFRNRFYLISGLGFFPMALPTLTGYWVRIQLIILFKSSWVWARNPEHRSVIKPYCQNHLMRFFKLWQLDLMADTDPSNLHVAFNWKKIARWDDVHTFQWYLINFNRYFDGIIQPVHFSLIYKPLRDLVLVSNKD